jgi:hypothetical protein
MPVSILWAVKLSLSAGIHLLHIVLILALHFENNTRYMQLSDRLLVTATFLMIFFSASAQKASNYDPHKAFAADFYPAYGDEYRTADGRPGPKYWQNRADYNISASLDDNEHNVKVPFR